MSKNLPTIEEVREKYFYGNRDIQVLCGCGANKATQILKAVLNNQDSFAGIFQSRVSKEDFEAWLRSNRRKKKETQ